MRMSRPPDDGGERGDGEAAVPYPRAREERVIVHVLEEAAEQLVIVHLSPPVSA
jgi:hypothetical protein